ncbi:ArsR/SmtB family transcription factor [Marininema mesophilum]|nr:winged helix-turn-helix domain-containing protein [Marininema mesophilum]
MLDWGMRRHTYQVKWDSSLLWEAVLGIAAATYTEIHPTLEKSTSYWESIVDSLPLPLQIELEEVKKQNTWKTLLHLLFQSESHDLGEFLDWMKGLENERFRYYALPYLGNEWEDIRQLAVQQDTRAIAELIQAGEQNPMFPSYIRYIIEADVPTLKDKLTFVFQEWYQQVVTPNAVWLGEVLQREVKGREKRIRSLTSEQQVEEMTGISYSPEPFVHQVVLIPQVVYRPWTIQGSAPGTRIFYYPVSDESLSGERDSSTPPSTLIRFHKALGDEKRLRILKLLQQKQRTLQELAKEMNLPKTTVHHHLRMLRSAHLVEMKGSVFCVGQRGLAKGKKGLKAFLEEK